MGSGSGVFITVDGPSGVGKSTVAQFLGAFLAGQGRAVTSTTEPSSAAIGELAAKGYPAARYDIGDQDSETVQRDVAHLVCTRLGL